jgi:hypothetical protein
MGSSRIIPASQVVKGSGTHEPANHPHISKLLTAEKSSQLKNPRSKIPRLVFSIKIKIRRGGSNHLMSAACNGSSTTVHRSRFTASENIV